MRKLSLTIFFIFTFTFFLFTFAFSQIPHLINYQGKLTDTQGKPVPDGTHSLTFRIYDADSGGSLLWEETQNFLISKGIFSCLLGGVTELNLAFDKPYWLAIKVGSDSEMTPRQQIASVGYAMRAERANRAIQADNATYANNAGTAANAVNADMLDGKHANEIVRVLPTGSILIQQGASGDFATYPGDNNGNRNLNGISTQSGTWERVCTFWSDTTNNYQRYTYAVFIKTGE